MRRFLLALGAIVLLTVSASAASIVQMQSVAVTDVPITTSLSFLQFNGPGTLISVEIEVTADVAAVFQLSNPFTSPKTVVDADANVEIRVRNEANTLTLVTATATASPLGLPIVLNPGDFLAVGAIGAGPAFTNILTNVNPDFASFIGAGSIILPVLGSGNFMTAVEGGDLIQQNDVDGGAMVKVTYNYRVNDVPEPGTWAMMGAGIGLLGLARLRRRS